MCVPAHGDRDFEFATKFNIPIIQVIAKDGKEIENMTEAYTEASGTMINSGEWNGMESAVLKKKLHISLKSVESDKATVNYKLRDWVSRAALLGRANPDCTLSGLWSSSGTGRSASIDVAGSRFL